MPIITAPIHMTAKIMNKSLESDNGVVVGNWTPSERFMQETSFKTQQKSRVFKVGKELQLVHI